MREHDRYMPYIDKIFNNSLGSSCWKYTASSSKRPRVGTRKVRRFLYAVLCAEVKGDLPCGLQHSHICGNEWCVNPDHIEYETLQDNQRRKPEHVRREASIKANAARSPEDRKRISVAGFSASPIAKRRS